MAVAAAEATKAIKKAGKVKPPLLSLDSLNLLHTHTVLSTTGHGKITFCITDVSQV
jgi:hypothetical protein